MKTLLVYAEILDFITPTMREDPLVQTVSDTGIFLITTEENSKKYEGEFYPASAEAVEAYQIKLLNALTSLF